jgi:uncharacterized membrane protein YcaP (DUF421 family)
LQPGGSIPVNQIAQPFVDALVLVAAVILLTRLDGLRSFAKMSSFDFAMTVAIGSALAGTILGDSDDLPGGLATLAALFAVQAAIAILRMRWRWAESLVDNTPVMLMRHGRVLEEGLARGRITREDLTAVLRRSGVRRIRDVHAVVLETTGDVSVLAGGDGVDPVLVENVRGERAKRNSREARPTA